MGSLPKLIKKIIKLDIFVLLVLLLVFNPMGSSFVAAVNSQEFFSYHLRDVIQNFADEKQTDDFYLSTGMYENQTDGELFGAAKGRNLIMVQMESMQNLMVKRDYYGQEITPELNRLIDMPGSFYFNNFYYQIGSGNTSDAEFAVNNSMMASMESYTYKLYQNNYFKGLPWILSENGYDSYVFHGYKKEFWNRQEIYPSLGFEKFYSADDFENDRIEGLGGGNIVGISDHAFYEQAVSYMTRLPQPFYSFLISLSCHNPFKLPAQLREIEIKPQDDNIVGDYINAAHYADKCVGEFIEHLKEAGLYDNSLIVFYGDHFGLSKADRKIDEVVSNWLGTPYRYDMMMNIPFIIHIPGITGNAVFENSGGQLDVMPTLAYLLGIEKLDTFYFGQNLFMGDDSLVAVQLHMLKGSYIKGDEVFEIARDGIFDNSHAWNRRTGEAIPVSECAENSKKAKQVVEMSLFYLNNDILRLALKQGLDTPAINEIIAGKKTALPDDMTAIYIESGDAKTTKAFINSMRNDKGKYMLLMSDDIGALLQEIETEYSGKSKVKGHASTDEAVHEEFLNIRSRIVPVALTEDNQTKLEYLGYDKIMLAPGEDALSARKIGELMKTNHPYGIVLSEKNWITNANLWAGNTVPVYIYTNIPAWEKEMPVYRQTVPWYTI